MSMKFNHEQFEAMMIDVIRKRQIACKELDEMQIAEAFKQALQAGDFQKLVMVGTFPDGAQSIIYIPFQQVERLTSEVERLRKLLDENGIDYREKDCE